LLVFLFQLVPSFCKKDEKQPLQYRFLNNYLERMAKYFSTFQNPLSSNRRTLRARLH
ncbi:hypothetical protein T4B_7029, partial [Trichinella pseudospiralis]